MALCGWGGEHDGQVTCVVQLGRTCGCERRTEVATCEGHLAGLQRLGGRSAREVPCPGCGVVSRGVVVEVDDLPQEAVC